MNAPLDAPKPAPQPKLGWTLLTVAYMAVIFGMSSLPGQDVPLPAGTDKIAHFAEYFGLGYLATRATGGVLSGFLVTALYGALDETHQAWVPARSPDLADWAVDLTAALAAALVAARAARRRVAR
ncbi:MAG TPA: VanZ family protein [Deinococcales bacterium]|nr:VanZ family protein [Deinococcales bacterium]